MECWWNFVIKLMILKLEEGLGPGWCHCFESGWTKFASGASEKNLTPTLSPPGGHFWQSYFTFSA